ncbi:MAG: dihydrolipoamide acetyltransferase family protein [Candidatus Humimicrobiaceae bacterium]
MMFEVIMPKLGLTMETGTIERWLKKEGDKIEEGDILFEVMTDKVSLEVESYNSGVLRKVMHFEGEEVPVTEVVAYIGGADEKIPDTSIKPIGSLKNIETSSNLELKEDDKTIKAESKDNNVKNAEIEKNIPVNKKIFITPLARKIARELNIDFKVIDIKGSGPRNRIIKDDILKYHDAAEEKKKVESISPVQTTGVAGNTAGSVFKLKGIRKIIADKMVLSKQTIPHIIISAVADVSELMILKEKMQKKAEELFQVKLTYTDFILKSAAMALRENIRLNSTLVDETAMIYDEINMGIAVAGEKGLIVPVIFNTDKLSIISIAKKRIELINKIKKNTISIDEISGGTFTVSNLGMYRVRSFTAIINPPQTVILTIGEIYKNLVMDEEKNIKQEYLMNLSVAVDHRIIDGYDGAKYLQTLLSYLENPYFIY